MITPAHLVLKDGVPYSEAYSDVYHTRSGGVAQAEQVFLAGNHLPERWQNQECFAILETGFGLGLNFMVTWNQWQVDPNACQRLHFFSIEKHPFSATDLALAHAAWPELTTFSQQLCAHWPPLVPGTHRLHLAGGRIILTLVFGDAVEELRRVEGRFNAFYLDGFSPAHNPELWSAQIALGLARCAAPSATLSTWSVAGEVRRTLDKVGFSVRKQAGFGLKRHMLVGEFRHRPPTRYIPPQLRTALVIGAGIAGSSIAERLASRGWTVTVLEAETAPGLGASGNIAGVMRPLPSTDDNRLAKLTRAGFLAIRQHAAQLMNEGLPIRMSTCGALHLAQSEEQALNQQKAIALLCPPSDFMQFLDAKTASHKLAHEVAHGGWFFPSAGWVQPPSVCIANLQRFPDKVSVQYSQTVGDLIPLKQGGWRAIGENGETLAQAAIAVIASGVSAPRFSALRWLPQVAIRGQVTHISPAISTRPLQTVVCGHGYIAPSVDGIQVLGASTVLDTTNPELNIQEHRENLDRLRVLIPGYLPEIPENRLTELSGRVGFRPASIDRLPIVGAIPIPEKNAPYPKLQPNLWCIQGFGARGIVWSSLMAELLASQIMGEPLPLPTELVRAVSPSRNFKIPSDCVSSTSSSSSESDPDCDTMSQV